MKEYTKEDIGNALYGEMSIGERIEFIRYTLKAVSSQFQRGNILDKLDLIKNPCIAIIEIIKTIEKEQANVKEKR